MATPTIVQEAATVQGATPTALTSPVNTATLGAGATAGNLLLFILAGDKNTGSPLAMTDNGDSLGWSVAVSLPSTSVSLYVAWKVADGGETTIIGTTASNSTTGNNGWCAELEQTGSGAWGVVASSTNITSETAAGSSSTGTTGAATAEGLALAAAAWDSVNTMTGTASWSAGWASEATAYAVSGSGGGSAALWVASDDVAAAATKSATFTASTGTDQISTALVAFGRAVSGLSAAATLTATVSTTAAANTNSPAAATLTAAASTAATANVDSPAAAALSAAAGSTVTGNVNSPAAATSMITASFEAVAEAANPEVALGGALPHVSFWAVDPVTDGITPLPHVLSFDLSPIRNGVGSVRCEYSPYGKNYDLLRAIVDDGIQLEVEIWVGGSPTGRMRALLMEAEGDDTAEDSVWTFAGHFLEWRMRDALLAPDPTPGNDWKTWFDNESPGTVMATLMLAAQTRGTLTDITFASFTDDLDSNGTPWSQLVNMEFAPHRSYDEILEDLVEAGVVEWEVTPAHQLRLYEPGSRGVDRTIPTGDFTGGLYPSADLYPSESLFPSAPQPSGEPLILRTGLGLREARRKYSSRDAGTDLWVAGGEGLYDSAFDATARARYGRQIERADSQNYILDDGALSAYIQNKIGAITAGALELTVGMEFGAGKPQPVGGFNIGDWVYIDSGRGRGNLDHAPLERFRIAQWSLTGDGEELRGTVSVNDLMSERISRLEKLIRGVAGGAVVVGTSLPEADTKPPATPTGVSASTLAYFDDQGQGFAAVTVSWSAVTTNDDGTALFDLSGYRIRYRYLAGGPTGFIDAGRVSSLYTTHTFSGVIAGATVGVSVQAYDRTELESDWSTEFAFEAASDATPPPIPSTPVVESYLGILTIAWDGLGSVGESMPSDFDRVDIYASTSAGFTPGPATYIDSLRGAGTMPSTLGDYGQSWYAKLISVDTSGNASAASAQDSATLVQAGDGDVSTLSIGKLTAGIMSALMTVSGIIRTAASGSRVELDTNGFRCYLGSTVVLNFDIPSAALSLVGRLTSGAGIGVGRTIVVEPSSNPAIDMYPNATLARTRLSSSTSTDPTGASGPTFWLETLNTSGTQSGPILAASQNATWLSYRTGSTWEGGSVRIYPQGSSLGAFLRSGSTGGGFLQVDRDGNINMNGRFTAHRAASGLSAMYVGFLDLDSAFSSIIVTYGTTMADQRVILHSWQGAEEHTYLAATSATGFTIARDGPSGGWVHYASIGVDL